MPITGRVDHGAGGILSGTPSGCWAMIGEDGNHYTQASNGNGPIQIGCAETNALADVISDVELAADLLSTTGMVGASGSGVVPVPGTPYIGWIAGNFSNEVYGVFYKINTSGLLELEGGFKYVSDVSPFGGFGETGQVAAVIEIDGEAFIALNIYAEGTGEPELCVAHIPYTGTNIDTSPGSWDARSTQTAITDGFVGGTSRRYYNYVNLKDFGDGVIGVLSYFTPVETGGPVIKYNQVDTDTQTAGPLLDLTDDFPEVVADAGTLYGGGSGTAFDDFTAPFIDGNTVIWARPFTDNIDTVRLHTYTMIDATDITYLGAREISGFTITGVAGDLESVRIYKEGPSHLVTLVDRRYYYFAQAGGGRGGHTQIIGA